MFNAEKGHGDALCRFEFSLKNASAFPPLGTIPEQRSALEVSSESTVEVLALIN
jgi:hypothetical protein